VAAVVTGALRAFADMGLILGVVAINVAIGMFQEGEGAAREWGGESVFPCTWWCAQRQQGPRG
jgi:hypothetical protein